MLSRGVVMLHDYACPHTATAMQDLIVTFGYSPDLALSDFHVFLHSMYIKWQYRWFGNKLFSFSIAHQNFLFG
jgi:hypothetical protein